MLPQLQSERQLAAIEAAAVPHMPAHAQRETIRAHARAANAGDQPKRATSGDLAASGITVEYVDAKGRPVADGTGRDGTGG